MKPRNSLRRRFTLAYLLFALGASAFFTIIVAFAVEGIEVHLVDDRLGKVAAWASPRHAGGLPVTMPAGLSFHHGAAIPTSLRGLPEGLHEVQVDGAGLHVLKGRDTLGDYVVVDHESDYEKVELMIYSLFAVSLVGFLLFSLFLGSFIGRRFVTPISVLASAVEDGSSALPLLDRHDELGVLARTFAAHTAELRSYLDRERFFTGDVSHELRTPLTVIIGAAEVLRENTDANPKIAAPVDRILQAAYGAGECVNVLLMLARTPERIVHSQTDLASIASACTERYRTLVQNKPVALRFEGGQSFCVSASPELCAAAIGNLVRNACEYTREGTVVVRLQDQKVIVEDTGPGLPATVRARLDNGVSAAGASGSAGTGLGLALVKRICEHLGATLASSERPGGGCRFDICFPADFTKT